MNKVILFDGECNICNYWVNFIIKNDIDDKFFFASLQSEYGKQQLEKFNLSSLATDTFVLIDNDNYYIKSDAALLVAKELKHWLKAFTFLGIIPKNFRDFIYDFIAKNRKKIFPTSSYCLIPSEKIRNKFLG